MGKINKIILFMVVTIFILLTVFGILIIYKQDIPKQNNEGVEETKISEVILDECTEEYDEQTEKTNYEKEKISPNCEIVLIKYYKECKDTINEYIKIPNELVNASKEELQKRYSDWNIKEFSNDKIELYKEFDGNCGEHYILREEQDKIVIYKLDEDGKEVLYEKTDISIEYLPDKDKKIIKEGMKINGREKLNEFIESFE